MSVDARASGDSLLGVFDRSRTIAGPGYSRWLVPPAALAIHLAIGQVYAFSVFKLPLTQILGITSATAQDWTQSELFWIFSVAIVFLGLSAAVFGTWLERAGPRKAMFAAACCFSGGFFISAFGVWWHQIWLVYLGYGVLGGIGLGIGYISPVSTLIKWFPDRPGMATGMAIMGFGGGAMIGSPLATTLMAHFQNEHTVGVAETFLAMGTIYFLFMMFGVVMIRLPAPGWKPAGYVPGADRAPLPQDTTASQAIKTPQFWLLWGVLFLNVTAGIGILEQASPMIQEMFGEITVPSRMFENHADLVRARAAVAGGFVALLSLFNMIGRFVWSSTSDYLGRRMTYAIYFLLGAVLYCTIPETQHLGLVPLFVLVCGVIISMYGGGFATVPAYLRDLFGTAQVGAIHGRLLTAWSAAGVAGPLLVNYIREYQIKVRHLDPAESYTFTMYLMAGLLVAGFVCNFLVRPLVTTPLATSSEVAEGFRSLEKKHV